MSRPPTYSDSALADAVRDARSWRGVLRELGLNATSSGAIRSVRRRAELLGFDHSHFAGQRRWTDQELARAVAAATSWSDVADELGLVASAGRAALRGHAARLALDTSHLDALQGGVHPDPALHSVDIANLPRAGSLLAAAWFTLCGASVSWPLEPCRYDVLVDRNGSLQRIQVKTTRVRAGASWTVWLSPTSGGRAPYLPGEVDAFFVIDGDLDFYLIPFETVGGRHSITLAAYDELRVGSGRGVGVATSDEPPLR